MADSARPRTRTVPTVLVVAGDANAAASAALAVERSSDGLATGIARSCGRAVERIGDGDVDCVVLTDTLPGESVVGAVERVREEFVGPIVVAARDGDETLASAVVAAGADEYVPVDRNLRAREEGRLVERIRSAVVDVRNSPAESVARTLPAGVALIEDGVVAFANPGFGSRLGVGSVSTGTELVDLVAPTDRDAVTETLTAAAATGPGNDPVSTVLGEDRTSDPIELRAVGVGGGTAVAVLLVEAGSSRGRERRLAALHRGTREMLGSKRPDDIADVAAETAVETLDALAASVFVYDRDAGDLRRAATSSGLVSGRGSDGGTDPAPTGGADVAWDVFVAGSLRHLRDDDLDRDGPGSRLVIPLGDSGVVVVDGATPDAFESGDVEFARTLATNVEVALDRAHRESTLLDRTDRLQERTRTLDRLRRIDAVVRDIGQLLVQATDRAEIETAVCERLAAVDGWGLAWIGRRSLTGDGLDPRSHAGRGAFVEAIDGVDSTGLLGTPSMEALETGTARHVPDVVSHADVPEWRELTLDYGFRSAVSIPLAHEGREYGVLEVYGEDPGVFGEAERSVLTELGEMIAYATSAVERRRALLAERGSELEVQLGTGRTDAVFVRVAERLDTRVSVEGVVPESDGTYLVYFRVEEGDNAEVAAAVESVVDRDPTASNVRSIGDSGRFEVRLSESLLFERTATHGGVVRTATADGGNCIVRIELPVTVAVREFVAALREEFPELTVTARRRPEEGSENVHTAVTDRMTDRQREVLEVAYHSGFFEWPRDSTGEEIATRVGVAPPTFHKHVRTAERKLLDEVLDRPDP